MRTILSILIKWLQGITELIVFLPILLMFGLLQPLAEQLWLWLGLLALCYLLGILSRSLLGNLNKWIYLLMGSVLTAVLFLTLMQWSYPILLTWVLAQFLYYRGNAFWTHRWTDVFPLPAFWSGIMIYFFTYFFFKNIISLQPFLSLFTMAGIYNLLLTLWFANHYHLQKTSSFGKQTTKLSTAFLKHNRFAVIFIVMLIAVIAFFQNIQEFVTRIIRTVILSIVSLVASLTHLFIVSGAEASLKFKLFIYAE